MQITLKRQVLAFIIIPMLIMALVFTLISISSIVSMGDERVKAYREALLNNKKNELKNYVEMAIEVLLEQPSQEQAKAIIKLMKYGDNGYLWINDFNHYMVAHPDPGLNESDTTDLQDPKGVYILREFVKACRENGEGFVPYMWKKLGTESPLPKISYVKKLGKWDWIVGTGVYIDDIDAMVATELQKSQEAIKALVIKNVATSVALVLLVSLMVAYFMERHLNRPMNRIIGTMQDFENDLTVRIKEDFKYEFGELARQFNSLVDKLQEIIGNVSDTAISVAASISEISATVEQQAVISSEQSASVSEITSTMEEFSATSKHISEYSNSVVEIATQALESTKNGAEAVETVMLKMKEINEDNQSNTREIVDLGRKSKEITKVMEIINNIADQTKLIAFNAALEASSAGEAGKRFGVVAAEIRRLADNVMDSTDEIVGKINEIQEAVNRLVIVSEKGSKRIHEGLNYSDQTARLLIEIVNGAKSTVGAAKQISLSTQQQETASDQVVIALKEIDEGARQTSASIGQVSSATNNLKQLSDSLRELVERFNMHQKH